MKYKVLFIFMTYLFLAIPNCLAKTITIDNITYDVEAGKNLELENLTYNANQDLLILTNCNYKSIKTNENLKILLNGDNYLINNDLYSITLSAKNLEIVGDGQLEIVGYKGISASSIIVTNATLKIKSEYDCMLSNLEYSNIILNNSNLECSSDKNIFHLINGNLIVNNSRIKVNECDVLVGGFIKNIYFNSSNLDLDSENGIMYSGYNIYISNTSHLYIKMNNNYLLPNKYILDKNITMLGSDDNINYDEVSENELNHYLKIDSFDINELLYERELELENKETEVEKKREELQAKDNELIELERYLKEVKENLDLYNEHLEEKENSLNQLEESLCEKENSLNQLEESLSGKENKLKHLEERLNEKENSLNQLEESLNEKELEIAKEENEYVFDKIYKDNYNESFDNIENPKTFVSFKENLIILVISFIGILVAIIIGRRLKYD